MCNDYEQHVAHAQYLKAVRASDLTPPASETAAALPRADDIRIGDMVAVGTVVMNRVNDPKFPHSVCGVVGQRNQFADGALWKPMREGRSLALARSMADKVLSGYRHPGVGDAKYFHTEGYTFPYTNMHYTWIAGGNAFYEKY